MAEEMNDRAYDRLANVLMLVAIASALIFDAGFLSHTVVGAIGGIAALASAYLYFSHQRRFKMASADDRPAHTESPAQKKPEGPIEEAGTSSASPDLAIDLAARWFVMSAKREKHHLQTSYLMHHHHALANLKITDRVFYGGVVFDREVANVVLSPDDVAACAIEIIQQLSKKDGDDRWEFHFGANGLRVSAKKGRTPTERIDQEADFDFFGQMPSTSIQ